MRKSVKRTIASVMAAVMTVSAMSVAAVTSYAVENESMAISEYGDSEQETTIVVDVSQGIEVTVDTSDFEYVNLNSRASSLPYSGGIAFSSYITEAYTPVFLVNASSNTSQLKLSAYNFDTSNNKKKKVVATLYTHMEGTSSNVYTANSLGTLDFTSSSIKVLFSGSTISSIDQVYLIFTTQSDYSPSFDYTISLT